MRSLILLHGVEMRTAPHRTCEKSHTIIPSFGGYLSLLFLDHYSFVRRLFFIIVSRPISNQGWVGAYEYQVSISGSSSAIGSNGLPTPMLAYAMATSDAPQEQPDLVHLKAFTGAAFAHATHSYDNDDGEEGGSSTSSSSSSSSSSST